MSDSSTVTRPADEPSPVERVDKWAEKPSKPPRFFLLLALLPYLLALSPLLILLREPECVPAPAPAAVVPSGLQDQVDALRQRVIVLEARADAAPAAATRPRSTLRAAAQADTNTAPAPQWGTTDLDREIADFTRSLNQEPAQ